MAPLPEARWFHWAGLGKDGRIYAFGGYVLLEGSPVAKNGLNEYAIVVYSSQEDRWTRVPAPPPFRYTGRDFKRLQTTPGGPRTKVPWEFEREAEVDHQRMTGASGGGGEIYWFTFQGPLVFDPHQGAWDQPKGPRWYQRERRYEPEDAVPAYMHNNAATATGPDGRIYWLGGMSLLEPNAREFTLLRQAEVYDPQTHAWSQIAPMQQARQLFAACFAPDGKLYVFGGYGHHGSITQRLGESDESFAQRGAEMRALARQALDSVEAWDPETDTWSSRTPMPLGVEGAGAALGADGRIYVVGGTPIFSSPKPVDRVQVYDPRTDSWSEGPPLNTPRHGHRVVGTPEGRIYAIGGTSMYSVFHPRQLVGGTSGKKGDVLDSVEMLNTAPRLEPQPAPPDRG